MLANRHVYLLVNIIYLQSYHQKDIGRLIIIIAVQVQIIHCKFSRTSNSYSTVWMVTDTVCTGNCLMPLLQTSHVLTFTVSIRWDNKRQFVISFFFYFTTKFLWDPKSDLGKLTVIKKSQHIKNISKLMLQMFNVSVIDLYICYPLYTFWLMLLLPARNMFLAQAISSSLQQSLCPLQIYQFRSYTV